MRTRLACAALGMIAAAAAAACTGAGSATDLNPEGPPMIRQVRLTERTFNTQGTEQASQVFAFGTHELAAPEEVHPVQAAVAVGNELRIVIDELLVGNYLEEIACRGLVDEDGFARIPLGADPDDIARCASSDDVLPARCPASDPRSVCICRRAGGCVREDSGAMVAEGSPLGVRDRNQDGAADELGFIAGAVGIQCGSISVPISTSASYWNPSGTQNRPAMGGFDVLGPAIVLVPDGPLPTDLSCGLAFAPEVVDKQGIQVCAPEGGDIAAGCLPGDVSAFRFGVEALRIRPPQQRSDVPTSAAVRFTSTAPVDPATLGGIQIEPAPPGAVTLAATSDTAGISIAIEGGWAGQTTYTVTFPTTIADTFARPMPQSYEHSFTTAP